MLKFTNPIHCHFHFWHLIVMHKSTDTYEHVTTKFQSQEVKSNKGQLLN